MCSQRPYLLGASFPPNGDPRTENAIPFLGSRAAISALGRREVNRDGSEGLDASTRMSSSVPLQTAKSPSSSQLAVP